MILRYISETSGDRCDSGGGRGAMVVMLYSSAGTTSASRSLSLSMAASWVQPKLFNFQIAAVRDV